MMRRSSLALLGAVAALTLARPALAVPACSSLPGTVVYIESGDTQENLLKVLGRQLRDAANITLAFQLTGSCSITSDFYTGTPIVGNALLDYIPSTAENPSWDPTQVEENCTFDSAGVPADVGIAALFVDTCGLGGPPAGSSLALVNGPVQAYTFVVPTASSQQAIWAEEAYYAFGFGNANKLLPWNDQELMFIRPPSKSTLVATAASILLPPNRWLGVPEAASQDVATAVSTSTNPEPTIGILGAEVYDADRNTGLKTLAFRAYGQNHAYYPDSTATAFNKQNVRDGHYTLWSPTEYITRVNGSGAPVNPAVAYLEDLVVGAPVTNVLDGGASIDGLADVIGVGLIPDCAMHVSRTADGYRSRCTPRRRPATASSPAPSRARLPAPHPPAAPPARATRRAQRAAPAPRASTASAKAITEVRRSRVALLVATAACALGLGAAACTSSDDSSAPPASDAGAGTHPDAASSTDASGGSSPACVTNPTTYLEIINACTDAQAIDKTDDLSVMNLPDGGLRPLP